MAGKSMTDQKTEIATTSMIPTGALTLLTGFPSTRRSRFPTILLASLDVSQTLRMSLSMRAAGTDSSTECDPGRCFVVNTFSFLLRGQDLGAANLFMWSLIL